MTNRTVYTQGWSLNDIRWSDFDASKVQPWMLSAVKAAALVEHNAPDYVGYLKRVFRSSPQLHELIERWGEEETRHGEALGRWAELADPSFDFAQAFARFREGYTPPHFVDSGDTSIRGSRRGEMIARCVVESGTSSYYTAIRDATDEPVLKQIAGHIAADEYRHYKLFFETLHAQDEPELPFWRKFLVAVGRITESDDDELAYAFYCANVPSTQQAQMPYRRAQFARASQNASLHIYRRHHIQKLVQMVAKALGANPQSRFTKVAGSLMWKLMQTRASRSALPASAGV